MYSVTQRVADVKQPYGGYLKPKWFDRIVLPSEQELYPDENVHPTIIGLAVDYLTRYMLTRDVNTSFAVSIAGLELAAEFGVIQARAYGTNFLNNIKGLDDESIRCACKMVTFDVWYRNPNVAEYATPHYAVNPDKYTIHNVRTMVERALRFFNQYGPVTKYEFTFGEDGYSDVVTTGDGDFLTQDTLWDFKVSKNKPTSKQTLQILMYYIMGKHSGLPEFDTITKIGLFNPRLNVIYVMDTSKIPERTIQEVEFEVICY